MKQIILACIMYKQDYDGKFPKNWTGQCSAHPAYREWIEVVEPYVKNTQVFVCPSTDEVLQSCAVSLGRSGVGRRGGYAAPA